MSTKLQKAIKEDLADYKKDMTALEKEKTAIDKKMAALNKKYTAVLDLARGRGTKTTRRGRKIVRGRTKKLLLNALAKSTRPMKPREIHSAIAKSGVDISAAAVRQQLFKLVATKEVSKDANKRYVVAGAAKQAAKPKTKLRKKSAKKKAKK